MSKKNIKQIAHVIVFMALAIALSPFTSLPIGIAKINPTQHFVNVFLAVLVTTRMNVAAAAGVSLIRNALGLGTLLAFPGSMIGAFLSGLAFRMTRKISAAVLGEIIGTGLIAPLLSSFLIAPGIMGKEIGFMALLPGFLLSSISGSLLAFIVLLRLEKAHVIHTEPVI
ncbi:energy coupling factor transporter S component ThiW [Oceanispirochaeta crateris]|uniref:Energy coupling factor transporter S component ThiW n=1 Tax=Oceanispirochaeta crateris TaxID=2518645 RepID=A0A5C1QIV7_9SPIO|nr:energy coupling factor transporter S component ThiW [Oceanispirochaeta crateris]QEN08105.1 energy coupling factor transporter S component ThiW [Oceanispirochaeta crateris]